MMNGSRYSYRMPAIVRRTGKPSPSRPAGAVEIASTGRSVSPRPAPVTLGRVSVSAVTAAMAVRLLTRWLLIQLPVERAYRETYSRDSGSYLGRVSDKLALRNREQPIA